MRGQEGLSKSDPTLVILIWVVSVDLAALHLVDN